MRYGWKDYRFDPEGMLLTRNGRQVEISRRALQCIVSLIGQRDRVVPYDELIQCIWGHGNVSNEQLTKIVVAARRAVGDDGQAQVVIRTMPGWGYRWIQPVEEIPEASQRIDERSGTPAPVVSALPDVVDAEHTAHAPDIAMPSVQRRRSPMAAFALLLLALLALLAAGAYRHFSFGSDRGATGGAQTSRLSLPDASAPAESASAASVPDTVDGLREAMRLGRHELVQRGLSRLPPAQFDTAEVRMLQIELEIERGRFDEAERRLAVELDKAQATDDRLWQAKLLTLQSESRADAALSASLVLPPASSAVALLESPGEAASSATMARALSARGNGLLIRNDLQAAITDLARARDILQKAGDARRAAKTQRYLAHVWLREGRMTDALEQMVEAADTFDRLDDPVNELAVRNMATRVQVEQLRWDEALAGSERSLRLSEKVSGTRRSVGALQLRSFVLTHLGRLREAGYFFEEVKAIDGPPSHAFNATYALASGRLEDALAQAALAFEKYGPETRLNLNLESRDGALLLWVIAAQGVVERGGPMPVPTPAQRAALERPESDIGRIAHGRWLWTQGRIDAAETQLRRALTNPRATGRLLEILYANEALIELLLARGDTASAERALTAMWGRDPDRFGRDYRANLLALRVALASGDDDTIASAHRQAVALAGERALPMAVVQAYARHAAALRRPAGSQMASVEHAP